MGPLENKHFWIPPDYSSSVIYPLLDFYVAGKWHYFPHLLFNPFFHCVLCLQLGCISNFFRVFNRCLAFSVICLKYPQMFYQFWSSTLLFIFESTNLWFSSFVYEVSLVLPTYLILYWKLAEKQSKNNQNNVPYP